MPKIEMKQFKESLLLVPVVLLIGCGGFGTNSAAKKDVAVSNLLQTLVGKYSLPALVGANVTSHSIRLGVSGVSKQGETRLAELGSLWHIGSNAKAINATLCSKLVEEGTMRWDMTLRSVFPELVGNVRAEYLDVTLKQLLQMQAGLPGLLVQSEIATVPTFPGDEKAQRLAFVKWAMNQAPEAPVGTFFYSNSNNPVAAAMIERVTGKNWLDLMKSKVFRPLGMNSVVVSWPARQGANQPYGHLFDETTGRHIPQDPNIPEQIAPVFLTPSGDLSMTANDFAKFLQFNLRGLLGQNGLLRSSSVKEMHTPGSNSTYAMGWEIVEVGGRKVSTLVGSLELFNSQAVIDTTAKSAQLCVTNGGASEAAFAALDEGVRELNGLQP
jgi:D-alanyl-D-alanine carboxypeptidase